ncbi:MAG: hypothetical protein K1X74_08905 [Pirellulales bacterium]|nr:hypothetical protein [Pirellulales bacterium]
MRPCTVFALCASLFCTAGCCQSQPTAAVNPFFRSTVPPPGTVAQPPGTVMPAPIAPPTITPAPGGQYAPSSGFQFQGSAVEPRRSPAGGAGSSELVVDLDGNAAPLAARQTYDAEGDDLPDAEEATATRPAAPTAVVRMLDAPEEAPLAEGSEAAVATRQPTRPATVVRVLSPTQHTLAIEDDQAEQDSAVETASYEEPVNPETAEPVVAAAEPSGRFSHADDYSLLEGRLEYSQKSRQWKLRYIPLDGVTDGYGGSVNLGESSALADYQEGDFVVVRGEVKAPPANARSFAPQFEVASVARQ